VTQKQSPVIVVGSGWTGLAAAVELSRYRIPVTVLESAKQMGGRARRVLFEKYNAEQPNHSDFPPGVDNGQHLLVGAYDSTLSLLRTIGVAEDAVFKRADLQLSMMSSGRKAVKLTAPRLPAPLHLAVALLRATGLNLSDRLRALRFCSAMAKQDFALEQDESCRSLLSRHDQPQAVIKALWEPLCLGGLNTHLDDASAQVFLRMLRETFAHTRHDSNLLFTRTDLGNVFPDPAMDFIERMGGSVKLGQRVTDIHVNNDAVTGVSLPDRKIKAQQVILATPYYVTAGLCAAHPRLEELAEQLNGFKSNPICTVYLQYPPHTTTGKEMLGLMDCASQWVFDRKLCGQPGLMAVIISGTGSHMNLRNTDLAGLVEEELARHFPRWPKALRHMVIREKRATFHCAVDINRRRPPNRTSVKGLWIAGDYTDTGLPATLESAVRSGIRSARAVIDSGKKNA
jgi:squalene-associated FAD-dependent desaturase